MSRRQEPSPSDTVVCDVCLKEIPRDLAKSEEATEYVHYFCGAFCYDRWRAGEKAEIDKKPD